mgnify:FL=1|jgi:hypothetical protein
MPLPKPKENELQEQFMRRCVADDTMNMEYPNIQQRVAVCYTQWRDK